MWLRRQPARHSASTRAATASPTASAPATTSPRWTIRAAQLLRVLDAEAAARTHELAAVADLPAALGVERRLRQDHLAGLPRRQALHGSLARDQRGDVRLGGERVVADELAGHAEGRVALGVLVAVGGERRLALGALALRRHLRLEAGLVDLVAARGGDLDRELGREPVRVVEHEQIAAGHAPALLLALDHLLEQLEAARQRRQEAALLLLDDSQDERALLGERGVGLPRGLNRGRDDAAEEGLAQPERVAEVDGAAEHAPQHVAAALVAGQHAVLDQERRRPRVLGDGVHRARPLRLAVGVVGDPRGCLDGGENAPQLVGLVDRARALQHPRQALEARAGVDVLRWQRLRRAVRPAVVGHEHEVPDLEEVARVEVDLAVGQQRLAGDVVAEVVVQLGARPARAGLAGVPVVPLLGAVAQDPLGGDAAAAPQRVGLVVVDEDGDPQPLGVDAELLGEERPGPLDRVALEVVAEGEVAQHLEEREVRGVADLLDVGGAEALLHGGEAARGRLLEP